MTTELKPRPFDRTELQKCHGCDKGVMHTGDIHFYEVVVTQCVADLASIQKQHGLEMMMGAAAPLAAAMSPTTNVAHRMPPVRRLLCSDCALIGDYCAVSELLEGGK